MPADARFSQAGFSSNPSGLQPLTLPVEHTADHSPPTDTQTDPKFSGQGSQYWVVAFIAGLVVLWLLRRGSEHLQSNALAVNSFNFLAVFFMAALGFILAKLVLTYVPVPGLTALVHAL